MRVLSRSCLLVALLFIAGCSQAPPTAPGAAPAIGPSAAADTAPQTVPISGRCTTSFPPPEFVPGPPPALHVLIDGSCQISHLGKSVLKIDQLGGVAPPFAIYGHITYTAPNGDQLYMLEEGKMYGVPNADFSAVTLSGELRIDGGTGRFERATGTVTVTDGVALLSGTGWYTFDGSITYAASDRRHPH